MIGKYIMEIITKNYNGFAIDFSTNSETELYLNITEVANKFGKRTNDQLRLKEYIEELGSHYGNSRNGDFVVVRKGGNDKSIAGTSNSTTLF